MNQNVINFKVFLRENGDVDIRRFTVDDQSVVTNFLYVREKILSVFPKLRNLNFKITWKDVDDDEITITSDEDLITAFTEMNSNVKNLTVTVLNMDNGNDMEAEPITFQPRVMCDSCDTTITGFRYKCMQCPDFDLCASCEQKGNHSHHIMIRISQQTMPKCMPKLMNCLARSIRKSGLNAAKETYRMTKHFNRSSSFSGHHSKDAKTPKTDKKEQTKSECPIEGIIGDLASSFFTNLNADPKNANAHSAEASQSQANDVLGNILRNVLSAFSQTEAAPPSETATASATATKPNTATATPQESPKGTESSIPMDVEPPKNLYPNIPEMQTTREPGWTFVPPTASNTKQDEATAPPEVPATSSKYPDEVIMRGLAQLEKMGFSNESELIELLIRYEGNIGMVVNHLFEKSKP